MEQRSIVPAVVIKNIAAESYGTSYTTFPRKKVFFEGILPDGRRSLICTPHSKYYEKDDRYWVDITDIQKSLLNTYDHAIIIFRLEGRRLVLLKWSILNAGLGTACMQYNEHEKEHWKLYIYKDYISVLGNHETIPIEMVDL